MSSDLIDNGRRLPSPGAARNTILIELRKRMGCTQAQMARLCGVGRRTYQNWEWGLATPTDAKLAGLLTLARKQRREDVGFRAVQAVRLGPVEVAPSAPGRYLPEALAEALAGRLPSTLRWLRTGPRGAARPSVEDTDVYRLRHRARMIAATEEEFGGGAVGRDTVFSALRAGSALLRGRFPGPQVQRELRHGLAELALAGGSALVDEQDYDAARTCLLFALATAPAAPRGSRAQATVRHRAVAALALAAVYARDRDSAEDILNQAERPSTSAPPTADTAALLTALRANVAAMADEVTRTHELVGQARVLFAEAREPVVHPALFHHVIAWAYGIIEFCNGRLGENYATDAAAATVALCEPQQHRTRTLARVVHMMALLNRGFGPEARDAAAALLPDVQALRSPRIRETISMAHLLPGVIRGDPGTGEVIDLLVDYDPPVLAAVPQTAQVAAALRRRRHGKRRPPPGLSVM